MTTMTDSTTTRAYNRLSPAVWAEIRALWETGEPTLDELALRYSITTRALQSHFQKNDTMKGAKAMIIAAEVKEAIFADSFEDRETKIAKGRETRATDFANASKIESLIMAQVDEAQKDPTAAFRASGAIKALALAAQALERTTAMKWRSLGLDRVQDTDELPEIHIVNLTEDDIQEIRRSQEAGDDSESDDSDDEIVVTH
jgi:hypothetical protein